MKISKSKKSSGSSFVLSRNTVSIGSRIGAGTNADIHKVKGHSDLVVKLARGYHNSGIRFPTEDDADMAVGFGQMAIRSEARFIVQNKMTKYSMFRPTKIICKKHSDTEQKYIGIVRPKVIPILDYTVHGVKSKLPRVTISQLSYIHDQIVKLSKEGIVFSDGIQIGFDKHKKPIVYDAGGIYKTTDIKHAFKENEEVWQEFLGEINFDLDDLPANLETLRG